MLWSGLEKQYIYGDPSTPDSCSLNAKSDACLSTQSTDYRNDKAKSLQKGLCRSTSHPYLEIKLNLTLGPRDSKIFLFSTVQEQLEKAFKLINTVFLGKSALSKLVNSKKPKQPRYFPSNGISVSILSLQTNHNKHNYYPAALITLQKIIRQPYNLATH